MMMGGGGECCGDEEYGAIKVDSNIVQIALKINKNKIWQGRTEHQEYPTKAPSQEKQHETQRSVKPMQFY